MYVKQHSIQHNHTFESNISGFLTLDPDSCKYSRQAHDSENIALSMGVLSSASLA